MFSKSEEGCSRIGGHNTNLEYTAMVCQPDGHVLKKNNFVATKQIPVSVISRRESPSDRNQGIDTGGLENFRQYQCYQGLSRQTAELITHSWRSGTKAAAEAAYGSSWRK